jgi:hypothetical protein
LLRSFSDSVFGYLAIISVAFYELFPGMSSAFELLVRLRSSSAKRNAWLRLTRGSNGEDQTLKADRLPETSRLIATRSRLISHMPNPDTDRTQHAASRNAGQGG